MSTAMEHICYIVGAGENANTSFSPCENDFVIAADGGLRVLQEKGIRIDLILGDFDSLGYVPSDARTVLHPMHKDETDLMLACREGLSRGYRNFCLYGGLGGKRFSHSVANVQLLRWLADQGARGTLFGDGCVVRLLRKETVRFPETQEGFFSVFTLEGSATVSECGSLYELDHATLTGSYPLGVSNEFCGKQTEITVANGDVLLILEENA